MQFRFRKYNEETHEYKLVAYCDIKDYDVMFKTLTYMAEHKCEYPIEVNTTSIVETLGDNYSVNGVSLCVGIKQGEDELVPHFVVDIEEEI